MRMKDSSQNFAKRFRHEADQLDTVNIDLDWWHDAEVDQDVKDQLELIKTKLSAYRESMYDMALMLERGE